MRKRVAVLGAVGTQTVSTVIDLCRNSGFEEIVIADLDVPKLEELARALDDPRLQPRAVDATEVRTIEKVVQGCDVIINGMPGEVPGYDGSFVENVVEGAARAGVRFIVDLNDPLSDDAESSIAMFAEWDAELHKLGVGVMPFSGGVTTSELLAIKAAGELEEVHEINVFMGCATALNQSSPGLIDTTLYELDPRVKTRLYYEDGEFKFCEPFGMQIDWQWPESVNARLGGVAYALTHTEPLTLAEVFPDAKRITSRGVLGDLEVNGLMGMLVRHGVYEMEPIDIAGSAVSPLACVRELMVRISDIERARVARGEKAPDWYGEYSLAAEVSGLREGQPHRVVYTHRAPGHPFHELLARDAVGEFGVGVGVPMSVTACMLLDGEIPLLQGLVRNADLFPDPDKYFAEMAARGFELVRET